MRRRGWARYAVTLAVLAVVLLAVGCKDFKKSGDSSGDAGVDGAGGNQGGASSLGGVGNASPTGGTSAGGVSGASAASDAGNTGGECADGAKNGLETDTDCGGPDCDPCADGDSCVVGTDCASRTCDPNASVCTACDTPCCNGKIDTNSPTFESDVDCGGPVCGKCDEGDICIANSDCESRVCNSGHTCDPMSGGSSDGGCPTGLAGPTLVNVPAPAGSPVSSYCVDATEVTNAQYAAFLADSPSTSGQDTWCSFNTSYTPSCEWPATGKDAYPVVCVDWCDAYAYCKWAGKHLCGKIGGGANAYADFADAAKSEWFNACSAGGSLTYPYGDTYSGTACNGADNVGSATVPAGSMETCEGGYGGLYDLSGNVWEWEDSCDGATGPSDACRLRGGSPYYLMPVLRCDIDYTYVAGGTVSGARDGDYGDIGFRCCGG